MTGRRATDAVTRSSWEWFRPGEEPVGDCVVHQRRAINLRTGLLGTADTPRAEVDSRLYPSQPMPGV